MKSAIKATLSVFTLVAAPVLARNLTIINKCSYTVWPAVYTDPNAGSIVPAVETGWQAVSGSSHSFAAPDEWKAGRIWGRTGCSFSTSGTGGCTTGTCMGGLKCTGLSSGPTTVAEFTFGSIGGSDYIDVSLVDGFNIPVAVANTAGCKTSGCSVDLNANCPDILKLGDPAGKTVGCKSACLANLDGSPANSKNCCTGQYSTPSTCPASQVQYYSYFKNACPDTYAYSYDEPSGTSLITCSSSKKPDYTITFCP